MTTNTQGPIQGTSKELQDYANTAFAVLCAVLIIFGVSRLVYAQTKNYKKWDMDRTLLLTAILSCLGTSIMYFYLTGQIPVESEAVQKVFYIAEVGINAGYLLCLFRLLKTIYEVIGWETSNLVRLKYSSLVLTAIPFCINIFYKIKGCYSAIDLAGYILYLLVCLTLLYISMKVNNEVELRQAGEFGQIDISNYRPSPFLSLELDIFWDRFSWFQLLITSLVISCVANSFVVIVTLIYSETYAKMESCHLVYPLVYQLRFDNDNAGTLPGKYHVIAVMVMVLNFLMTDFLPYIFLLRIIEVNLIKKREMVGEEIVKTG